MLIRLLKPWKGKPAGDKIEVGDVLGGSLVRRKLAKALSGPPKDKAESEPAVQKG